MLETIHPILFNTRGDLEATLDSKASGPGRKVPRGYSGTDKLPVRSLPSQTRDGFYAHKVLGGLTSGKKPGPVKLESAFGKNAAPPPAPKAGGPKKLESGSAKHLAVKSAAHLKK